MSSYQYQPPSHDPVYQFKTDYPDIAEPVERMLNRRDELHKSQTAALHTRIFEEAMDVARPDWRDLRDNPEFATWMKANPDQQQAAQVPGVRAALKVLSAFDASKGRKPSPRSAAFQQTLDGYAVSEAAPTFKGKPGQSPVPSLADELDGFAAE